MVASSTPGATSAAVEMLESGGNAVDAAVAAAFAQMVTDPPMTSLAGRCAMLIRLQSGEVAAIDGATQAPAVIPRFPRHRAPRNGYQAVPVPGNPAALAQAVEQYGRLSLRQVLAPAIALSAGGFTLTRRVGRFLRNHAHRLAANPGAAQSYLQPDGSAYAAGDLFRQPHLAGVLERLAGSGPGEFYHGSIAAAITADVLGQGGYLQPSDLAAYRPRLREIVRASYRGYEVLTMGRKTGGFTLAEMLNILSHFSIAPGEPSAEQIEVLIRTIAQAMADRADYPVRHEQVAGAPPDPAVSPLSLARERAAGIQDQLGKPVPRAPAAPASAGDTTHVSVLDCEGNAVALTTSIGPYFGARVATLELGFLYAHSYNMTHRAVAGRRSGSAMAPAIVVRDGQPLLAIGAAGNTQIPAAVFQVVSNVLDRGLSLEEAIAAPRLFAIGSEVTLQEDYQPALAERFEDLGFTVEVRRRTLYQHLGIIHAVQYDPARQEFIGVADPIYDGTAAGPQQAATTSKPRSG